MSEYRKAKRVGGKIKYNVMDLRKIFKDEPIIELMYLSDLAEAIIRVEEKYCKWEYINLHTDHIQKTERVFAYELYHQFRLYTQYNPEYKDLRFDGEIGKRITSIPSYCGFNAQRTNNEISHFYPDLVLHKGQSNREFSNQKLIIEIKTKLVGRAELEGTLSKLIHYIKELNFQLGVFISVNTEKKELVELITELLNSPKVSEECKVIFNRIIIMNYNHRKLDILRLSQM